MTTLLDIVPQDFPAIKISVDHYKTNIINDKLCCCCFPQCKNICVCFVQNGIPFFNNIFISILFDFAFELFCPGQLQLLPKYTSALLFSEINPSSERHRELFFGC
jgi:hypothetical protein